MKRDVYGFADHRLNQLIQPTVSRIYNFVFDQTTSITTISLSVKIYIFISQSPLTKFLLN
nr:MAG TPA: hypothetical protein [Podoviridae sp. ctfN46]